MVTQSVKLKADYVTRRRCHAQGEELVDAGDAYFW